MDFEFLEPQKPKQEVPMSEASKEIVLGPDETLDDSIPDEWLDKLLEEIPESEEREGLLSRIISGDLTNQDRDTINRIRRGMGFNSH